MNCDHFLYVINYYFVEDWGKDWGKMPHNETQTWGFRYSTNQKNIRITPKNLTGTAFATVYLLCNPSNMLIFNTYSHGKLSPIVDRILRREVIKYF